MVPISEERTVREFVTPSLVSSGWSETAMIHELPITSGQRNVVAGRVRKGQRLRADIALLHRTAVGNGGHPIRGRGGQEDPLG